MLLNEWEEVGEQLSVSDNQRLAKERSALSATNIKELMLLMEKYYL